MAKPGFDDDIKVPKPQKKTPTYTDSQKQAIQAYKAGDKKVADFQDPARKQAVKDWKAANPVEEKKKPGDIAKAKKVGNAATAKAPVAMMKASKDQLIDPKTGQVKGNYDAQATTAQAFEADTETVDQVETTGPVEQVEAATYDPTLTSDAAEDILQGVEAQTAQPTKQATVQGQLESLMADFEEGTPPWASGAMRAATAAMQSRGLGASSVAGQAIVQAAMESATAIAAQDASTFARFEEINLNNRQQTMVLKTQTRLSAMFEDASAQNAAAQFNAQSENQINQFMASLQEQAKQFNANQINSMRQFNIAEVNKGNQFNAEMNTRVSSLNAELKTRVSEFNSNLRMQRDQFNAQNSLVIAQANAQWRQTISTVNTAAKNAANMQKAKDRNALTAAALDNVWQTQRDQMKYAWASSESNLDRAHNIALTKLKLEDSREAQELEHEMADKRAKGALVAQVVGSILGIL